MFKEDHPRKPSIGIVGVGSIGLAYASCAVSLGHAVKLWAPRGGADLLNQQPLRSTGVVECDHRIEVACNIREFIRSSSVIIIAVPANAHRHVMDAVLPHLRSGQDIVVSSMASLSSLYLYEQARLRGIKIQVASLGTTAFTARRISTAHVHVMTKRSSLGVSCIPQDNTERMIELCCRVFGNDFYADSSPLLTTLSNTNAVSHVPLVILNWTRVERAEMWPQYHYLTPQVAEIIESADRERIALARTLGWDLPSVQQKLSKSFSIGAKRLADVAVRLHELRGGPAGPTDVQTRYLSEDVPFGLVFTLALSRLVGVEMPVTETLVAFASLILGRDAVYENDFVNLLGLESGTFDGLVSRLRGGEA